MIDITEILIHWHAGRSQYELAESLGVDRKTIRKYLAPALAADERGAAGCAGEGMVPAADRRLLAHLARPRPRSGLRVREPRRLPRGLNAAEVAALVGSLRIWRDRGIAGLMLYSGLRSAEVLGLNARDVDIGGRWVRVTGKGDKERRVRLDTEVARGDPGLPTWPSVRRRHQRGCSWWLRARTAADR